MFSARSRDAERTRDRGPEDRFSAVASPARATLFVVGRKPSLVEQIESDALDSSASLADALRKCVALGGRAGSADLRDWATRELTGYPGTEVPEYRKIVAPIVIDGIAGNMRITGQQISVHDPCCSRWVYFAIRCLLQALAQSGRADFEREGVISSRAARGFERTTRGRPSGRTARAPR